MSYVLGIDLGTSGVKALILSSEGNIVDIQAQSYTPDFLENGWVEQDPGVWWNATQKVLKEIMDKNSDLKNKITAISCSGQMHSSVFLDENHEVIRPAILWNDTRTKKQTKEIYEKVGEEQLLQLVQNQAFDGFTLPKILWLRENEPENFKKVHKVIMPKDYINFMLTGNIVTDVSDAAGTLLFDVLEKKFSKRLLVLFQLSENMLPKVIESTDAVGVMKKDIAEQLGFLELPTIIAGGADNSCSAVGNGVVSKGQAVVSVGTSGTVIGFVEDIKTKITGQVHLFNYGLPNSIYAMGVMLSAGESLNWLKRNILGSSVASFEEMNELAETASVGSNGLIFLPYLFGERCPYNDPNARGIFFGLSSLTKQGEIIRSVMEGVSFGLKDCFNLVADFTDINEVYITGGGAKSEIWGKIIADILNKKLTVLNVSEGPAFGAALIAAVGSGIFADFETAKSKTIKVERTIEPNTENNKKYEEIYKRYTKIYENNKNLF